MTFLPDLDGGDPPGWVMIVVATGATECVPGIGQKRYFTILT
ncbi:hypothetical protein [Paraburkholderia sp. BCC1885]|nr:hypothetical protein [Paraburkholderia sp. BCC1885]